jgi:hypothetical protein
MLSSKSLFVPLLLFSPTLSSPAPAKLAPARAERPQTLNAFANVTNPSLNISATFNITGYLDGSPTNVQVNITSGLSDDPSLGGPFLYHIHTNALPPDGNCTKALAHLDPYNVTEALQCGPALPQFCQEGDFSGKFGKINGTSNGTTQQISFQDPYLRFFPTEASLLGRSIVIHANNKTRLACGNITSTLDGTGFSDGTQTNKSSTYVKKYPSKAPPDPVQVYQPFNGTQYPPKNYTDNLPIPIPLHAVALNESVNIAFRTVTRQIKLNGTDATVKQPEGYAVSGTGPF